jgi:hypothetical protein
MIWLNQDPYGAGARNLRRFDGLSDLYSIIFRVSPKSGLEQFPFVYLGREAGLVQINAIDALVVTYRSRTA